MKTNILPKLFVLIGLPASGKSTLANKLRIQEDAIVLSSDSIRKELCGDVNDQSINEKVFALLHKRAKEQLLLGCNVIYDATNIKYKNRIAFLESLNKRTCQKIAVVVATSYSQCLKNNAQRERQVPVEVIKRMYSNFYFPAKYEGFDNIEIVYPFTYNVHTVLDICEKYLDYRQDNPNHSMSLGQHLLSVGNAIQSKDIEVQCAAYLHDIGKPFTKDFHNSKGEETSIAHYFNHHNVGAYESMFFNEVSQYNQKLIPIYIQWHMQPYFWEKDNNIKLQDKYRKLWGEDIYEGVMCIHESDKTNH